MRGGGAFNHGMDNWLCITNVPPTAGPQTLKTDMGTLGFSPLMNMYIIKCKWEIHMILKK